ncbi:MAG: flagellar hook-basal body complex protein, partial [Veillonellaceae bacterium]|nr:flagellar hook-basal body complex protein [Veillonellaceae bacterium]
MMRSLYSGVSGLKNHQTRMDVVGNNISNVNTTGFKSSRVTFSDTLSQTLSGASAPTENRGGTNPKQIGLGSATSSIDTLFTDGSVQSTGVNTDLCLSGNGLFVVKDGNLSYYTRNGNFKFDKQGYYVNSDGLKVQGWSATTPGDAINTNGQPSEICIPAGKTMAASATTKATFSSNLNAAEPMIKSITITTADGKTETINTDGKTFKVGAPYTIGGTASTIASLTLNM